MPNRQWFDIDVNGAAQLGQTFFHIFLGKGNIMGKQNAARFQYPIVFGDCLFLRRLVKHREHGFINDNVKALILKR
ncbi:hypothetical protein D3C76_1597300 [compost metagenome]